MVTDYIKRWAANNRLDSTYWQGFTPLHLSVAVPLVQELTVYLAEQAYVPSVHFPSLPTAC